MPSVLLSRSKSAKKTGRFVYFPNAKGVKSKPRLAKKAGAAAAAKPAEAPKSKWYPADDAKVPFKTRKSHHQQTKLRPNVVPGAVLILLAGRHKGKRVVFLKQLDSGLLLVTGPYRVNGVPLRRVNQAYVIATSTRVDIAKVDVSKLTDKDFAQKRSQTNSKKSGFLDKKAAEPYSVSGVKKDLQKSVDASLIAQAVAGGKRNILGQYLHAPFSLRKGQSPHLLKF